MWFGESNKECRNDGASSIKSVCVSAMLCINTVCKYPSHLTKSIFDKAVNINYYQMTRYAGLIAITVISALSVAVGTVLAASVINAGYTSVKIKCYLTQLSPL